MKSSEKELEELFRVNWELLKKKEKYLVENPKKMAPLDLK